MRNFYLKIWMMAVGLVCCTEMLHAQAIEEPADQPAEWTRPYKPFRIAGNLYYVGTYDLACYLVVTPEGNILINTGTASSDTQIRANIEALGFRFSDTRILLTTQAHYDHTGAMAAIREKTGAQVMADEKDAGVIADGGRSDYAFGGPVSSFRPFRVDRLLKDKDTVALGGTSLTMLHHPGHTKGSCSFLLTVKDERRSYKVLIANMPTIVTGEPFSSLKDYPEIADDYAYTLQAMKDIRFDIWLASHAGQFGLHEKHKPGDGYNPAAFMDRAGYDEALAGLLDDYRQKMKSEQGLK